MAQVKTTGSSPKRPAVPLRERSESGCEDDAAVVHLVAEYWPFARTGGLAEAVRGIATFQAISGSCVTVFLPLYRSVRLENPDLVPIWEPFTVQVGPRRENARLWEAPGPRRNPRVILVEHRGYFDREGIYGEEGADYPDNHRRFAFFNKAALRAIRELSDEPVVLHAHDWHTALAPVYLRTVLAGRESYDRMATVLSVHNAGFQGHFPLEVVEDLGLPASLVKPKVLEWHGRVNLLQAGLAFSDHATTVSPTHAHELRTPAGGFGLDEVFCEMHDRFSGILNGIDLEVWNPETDVEIEAAYSVHDLSGKARCKAALQREWELPVKPDTPLFGMTARLVGQKGLDLILEDDMLLEHEAQFVFIGEGEPRYATALAALARQRPDKVSVGLHFHESLEHRLIAGADMLLMPSQYEPCGLTQMRAQRYGALPVARRVGGLADTIEDQVTGFLFDDYTSAALERGVGRAIFLYRTDRESWVEHMREAMSRDFGWAGPAQKYLNVYRRALARHSGAR